MDLKKFCTTCEELICYISPATIWSMNWRFDIKRKLGHVPATIFIFENPNPVADEALKQTLSQSLVWIQVSLTSRFTHESCSSFMAEFRYFSLDIYGINGVEPRIALFLYCFLVTVISITWFGNLLLRKWLAQELWSFSNPTHFCDQTCGFLAQYVVSNLILHHVVSIVYIFLPNTHVTVLLKACCTVCWICCWEFF